MSCSAILPIYWFTAEQGSSITILGPYPVPGSRMDIAFYSSDISTLTTKSGRSSPIFFFSLSTHRRFFCPCECSQLKTSCQGCLRGANFFAASLGNNLKMVLLGSHKLIVAVESLMQWSGVLDVMIALITRRTVNGPHFFFDSESCWPSLHSGIGGLQALCESRIILSMQLILYN